MATSIYDFKEYRAFACVLVPFLLLPLTALQAQESKQIPVEAQYVLFLHLQASDAKAQTSPNYKGPSIENLAHRLRIEPHELSVLNEAAQEFVRQDKALADEGRQYLRKQNSLQRPIDEVVVHSFTLRREALAVTAFWKIQSRLSAVSFAGLQEFLESEFKDSIVLIGR